MGLLRTIARCTETAIKLPVAATWDFISLGNMGDGTSTGKVLRDHQTQKQLDQVKELIDVINKLK